MKKGLIIGGVVLAVLIVLGMVGYGYAQAQVLPFRSFSYGPGYGRGITGGFGGRGGMMGGWNGSDYGPMHEYMEKAIAAEFGISEDEVEALHDQGKTIWEYAQEQGLTQEQFQEKMISARTSALNQAVADGVITQQQADWMLQHMNQGWGVGAGNGPCHGGGAFGGRGPGWRFNNLPDSSES